MAPDASIRSIEERDVQVVFELLCALADHEGERAFVTTSPARLIETGFCENPAWRGFIAEAGDEAAAYATYTEDFHIWSGAPRIVIDDLYVKPEFRRAGLGRNLMECIFSLAEKTGAFVSWTVQSDNQRAIAFYRGLGARYIEIGKCGWRPPA